MNPNAGIFRWNARDHVYVWQEKTKQELIRRWDSEREVLYDDNIHVEASAYAHWTDLLISTFYYKYLW